MWHDIFYCAARVMIIARYPIAQLEEISEFKALFSLFCGLRAIFLSKCGPRTNLSVRPLLYQYLKRDINPDRNKKTNEQQRLPCLVPCLFISFATFQFLLRIPWFYHKTRLFNICYSAGPTYIFSEIAGLDCQSALKSGSGLSITFL